MSDSMARREFLTRSLATGAGVAVASEAAQAQPAAGKRQVYEVLVYTMSSADMLQASDAYFKDALVPALRRAGTGPVGVFTETKDPKALQQLAQVLSELVVRMESREAATAIGQGAAKGSGRQAIQRRGDAGQKRCFLFATIVFCHANPLFFHGCKGGPGRYSPPPAAP